ncbi:uncharacterized protein Z518_11292 [Rhinocladiella mackenziei CBS 650.93]|uniref:NADH:flavin oxidoreductase/NADH oxidase N-terminal domain-containing protein n=1 Tax=Rhinocladiella mackenziei CBS 650.93 TaxID=1442369 RepID=A0A0D2I1G4_9EURO|nr:uncharacterized protein Z518_11292 [Rhinocladiella mackenziei CBS 650.93]KIW99553.1 hypothetical protein Z518_11292 [Rhinocladiella mackenziei CBS 650.93]
MASQQRQNEPAPGAPFFTPKHCPGRAKQLTFNTPTIFRPLKLRGVTLRNRICVSPMCQYSCAPSGPQVGVITPLYLATLGHYAYKGAALVMVEATGVQPNGRISVNCPGLYNDTQEAGMRKLTDLVHSQCGLVGVQLSHGGRKSGTLAPFVAARLGQSSIKAAASEGGWPDNVVGPSGGAANSFDGKGEEYCIPNEISKEAIRELVSNWAESAKRAIRAGVDVLEIHGAHGYILHQFLSPITNHRTDEYGGSFENRIRLLVEVVKAVRAVLPETTPLILRISSTDWMEGSSKAKKFGSWEVESTIRLAKLLPDLGVDLLDVSSGGNVKDAPLTVFNAGLKHPDIAARIRRALSEAGKNMRLGVVGLITTAQRARDLVQEDSDNACADVVFVGRQFLKDPAFVLNTATELGVDVEWPIQIARNEILNPKL